MSPLDQLNAYLKRLESRLRFSALSKGTSLVTVSALVVTVVLVWIINRYAFSSTSLLWARILLLFSVATAIAFGLVIPLLRMNRRNAGPQRRTRIPRFPGTSAHSRGKAERKRSVRRAAGGRRHESCRSQSARAPRSHRPNPWIPHVGWIGCRRPAMADPRGPRLSRLWDITAMGGRATKRPIMPFTTSR